MTQFGKWLEKNYPHVNARSAWVAVMKYLYTKPANEIHAIIRKELDGGKK